MHLGESECPASLHLQETEDCLDEAGDVHLAAQVASCRWGLHINASRNARIRQVEWQELQLALEVGCGIKFTGFLASAVRLPAAMFACPPREATLLCRCSLVGAALQGLRKHTPCCKQASLGLAAA